MNKYELKYASMVIDTREESAKVVINGHEIDPSAVSRDFRVETSSDMVGIAQVTLTFYVDDLDVMLEGPGGKVRRMALKDNIFQPVDTVD